MIPIIQGLKGSNHEKVEAIPLVPATKAKTGVIQHSEALKAVIMRVRKIGFDFLFFMGTNDFQKLKA